LPCSKKHTTCPYSEPDAPSLHPMHACIFKLSFSFRFYNQEFFFFKAELLFVAISFLDHNCSENVYKNMYIGRKVKLRNSEDTQEEGEYEVVRHELV
jgi:hypothetical protein